MPSAISLGQVKASLTPLLIAFSMSGAAGKFLVIGSKAPAK
jgi:hypothetical protein